MEANVGLDSQLFMTMQSRPPAHDVEARLPRDGFVILRGLFEHGEIANLRESADSALATGAAKGVLSHGGRPYASRNLLEVWPEAAEIARSPRLVSAIESVLGPGCGLVRGLLFDKPPGQTWSLPWHQDMTIAVRDNRLPTQQFCKPTLKAGVPHVEAPLSVLERMLTARLHLDNVTAENGPLRVIPGSHHWGKALTFERDATGLPVTPIDILVGAGDVLLIRPLVAHSSPSSSPGSTRHRRIVHLEYASADPLPDGYEWHCFTPWRDASSSGSHIPLPLASR
jgi:hypothetical protein